MKPHDDSIPLSITESIEPYNYFWDNEWSAQLYNLVEPAPKLGKLVTRLTLMWRATAGTAYLPKQMFDQIRGITKGYNKGIGMQQRFAAIAKIQRDAVEARFSGRKTQRREVYRILNDVVDNFETYRVPDAATEVPRNFLWSELVKEDLFRLMLWGNQLHGFSSLFFAYDLFLVKVVRRASGKQNIKSGASALEIAYRETFPGLGFEATHVMDPKIDVARLIRHAIVHGAGEITDGEDKIKAQNYKVLDHYLQIYPENVSDLYHYLKLKVKSLCEHCATMKQFGYKP